MSKSLCGEHNYANINKEKIDAIIKALKENGATVTGNNPWVVDPHQHGIKLQGTWDQAASNLSIIVIAKNWYVPCSKIWDYIDPLIEHINDLDTKELVDDISEKLNPGGWTIYRTDISMKEAYILHSVLPLGLSYDAIAVATQIVNGTNYDFICNGSVVYPGSPNNAYLIRVYVPANGKPELVTITEIKH